MPVLKLNTNDPQINLATEEVLFRDYFEEEDLLIIWRSEPAFIVGRNQNPFLEINPDYRKKGIPVLRRISGGGTVYSDMGTLNFSIVTRDFKSKVNNYMYFLEPVIEMLKSYGIDASFKPKSHIVIHNKKISGNAQCFQKDRLLHHGTLLYNTDLSKIDDALIGFNESATGSHILSNKQGVINIFEYLPSRVSMTDLENALIRSFQTFFDISNHPYVINAKQHELIFRLANEKYRSWNWNYGKTPTFEITKQIKGTDVSIKVEKGIIIQTIPFIESLIGIKYLSDSYQEIMKQLMK